MPDDSIERESAREPEAAPVVLKAYQMFSVPCRPVLIEVQVPIDRHLGLGAEDYFLYLNANHCAEAAAEAIAEYIFGVPVECHDEMDQFKYQPKAKP